MTFADLCFSEMGTVKLYHRQITITLVLFSFCIQSDQAKTYSPNLRNREKTMNFTKHIINLCPKYIALLKLSVDYVLLKFYWKVKVNLNHSVRYRDISDFRNLFAHFEESPHGTPHQFSGEDHQENLAVYYKLLISKTP